MRRRLDAELVRRGLVPSRERARGAIESGQVLVAGVVAERPGRLVAPGEALRLIGAPPPFVGRGGEKLAAALDRFAVDVSGLRALDAGASTGGFTDCLLQRGASRVVALDVGRGQLHERLRADPRVEVRERTNLRGLSLADLDATSPFPVVSADLSFISLCTVLGDLFGLAAPEADLVVLVKPQFELGRRIVSRGRGVVRDPAGWEEALRAVDAAVIQAGAAMMGLMVSPLRGAAGNVEFLAHLKPGSQGSPPPVDIARVVAEAAAGSDQEGRR
ncbi:MAG: TlyA family RNA methyltransferase [Acidimicrobiales bacterium]